MKASKAVLNATGLAGALIEFSPRRDATIVKKLKAAGAIVIGKTNMGEFAAGYLGSAFGIVRNAYDPAKDPRRTTRDRRSRRCR